MALELPSGRISCAVGRRRDMGASCRVLIVTLLALVVVHHVAAEPTLRTLFHPNSKYFKSMQFPKSAVTVTTQREIVEQDGITVDLVHRDQLDSSFGINGKSAGERFVEAVQRSHERHHHLTRLMSPTAFGVQEFQSPVTAGNGEYLMTLSIGTPPQKFSTIVDTGSDLNWVQCLPCQVCYQQPGAKFDPSKSSSFKSVSCNNQLCNALPVKTCGSSCQYQYTYGDQSNTNGDLAFETISLDNNGAAQGIPNFAFGCGHTNQGTFAGAGGLVGLGQGPLSLSTQLAGSFPDKFSYCLVSLNSAAASSLSFGNVAVATGMQYTAIVPNALHPTYYYIGMTGISIGGNNLGLSQSTFAIDSSGRGGTIIDSGTTITMLTLNAYNAVLKSYQNSVKYPVVDGTSYGLDLCYNIAGVANPGVPDMVLHFQGADFQLLAENLFVIVDTAATTLCLAMAGSQGFSIIGNIQQQNHLVTYDRVGGKIGFATTKC